MELLYFVDRTLTRLIQALSKLLYTKLRLSLPLQGIMIDLIGLTIVFINEFLTPRSTGSSLLLVMAYFIGMLITYPVLVMTIGIILVLLHHFFDPEGYHKPDKLFSSGYVSWSLVILWIGFFVWFRLDSQSSLAPGQITFVYVLLPSRIFKSFASRKPRDHNRDKSKGMTEAMKRLLERCRSWLPVPQPAAG